MARLYPLPMVINQRAAELGNLAVWHSNFVKLAFGAVVQNFRQRILALFLLLIQPLFHHLQQGFAFRTDNVDVGAATN